MDPRLIALRNHTTRPENVQRIGIPLSLTPLLLSDLSLFVSEPGYPIVLAAISARAWSHLISNKDFQHLLDPEERYENVVDGRLGSVSGIELLTDMFEDLDSAQRFLLKEDLYVYATSVNGDIGKCVSLL